MNRYLAIAAVLLAPLVPSLAQPEPGPSSPRPPLRERIFFGGGIGLGFGDVDFVEISPVVGVRATERLSTGLGLLYRYREDGRFDPEISTNDFGASLFARYSVAGPLFLEAGYEFLSYEFVRFDRSTERDDFHSLLAGAGVYQPLGRNAAGYVAVLYNFSYDEDDPFSPYDEPWIYRAGVTFGF